MRALKLTILAIAAALVVAALPGGHAQAPPSDQARNSAGRASLSPSPVIAEFPSSEFQTSLQAIEWTFERIQGAEYAGKRILLSADSYEAGGEQYLSFDIVYEDGTFKFGKAVPDLASVARRAGFSPGRFRVHNGRRAISIQDGSPSELAGFLDRLYRTSFSIRLLPGKDSYNFGSEVMGADELPPLWPQ